jgi:hypothetical protein
MEEALALLVREGFEVPEDVVFRTYPSLLEGRDAAYWLPAQATATTRFSWDDLLTGDEVICVKVHPSVLNSDEHILAVFAHELHELSLLRQHFEKNPTILASELKMLLSEDNPNRNFHCLAWKMGDSVVLKYRSKQHVEA